MKERGREPMILTAAGIIFVLLILGCTKMAFGSDNTPLLEGLTPVVAGICLANDVLHYPCVKYIKKGTTSFYLAILSADATEVIYIIHVEGGVQTVVWQKGIEI